MRVKDVDSIFDRTAFTINKARVMHDMYLCPLIHTLYILCDRHI